MNSSDTCPQPLALHRLRQTLIHTGVLVDRADYLERLVPWLDNLLHDHPPEQRHLVRTYVHWTLLRRARQRARTRPFTAGAGNRVRTRIRATLHFLAWLGQRKLTLATVTQNAIDQWLTATPTDATYAAREFLYWARKHDLAGQVDIPKKPHGVSLQPITEDERWTQLRRCLHEETLPTEVRAAGSLVLLFGLPVSRVAALQHDDIHTSLDGVAEPSVWNRRQVRMERHKPGCSAKTGGAGSGRPATPARPRPGCRPESPSQRRWAPSCAAAASQRGSGA